MLVYPFLQFIWTAVCAAALVRQTCTMAGISGASDCLYVLVFSGTVFAYNVGAKAGWRRKGAWFALFCALACWLELPSHTRLAALAPAVIWALYLGFPGWAGLRRHAWAKPLAVASAWALVTVYLPLSPGEWLSWSGVLLQRFLFIVALAFGYDLLDRAADRQRGLRTLAGELGVQATVRVAYICLSTAGLLALVNAAFGVFPWRLVPLLLLSLLLSAWLIPWQLRRFGPQPWQKFTIDGLMAVQAVLVG